MKKLMLFISLLGFMMVVSACSKDDKKDILIYNLATDSKTWDPGFNSAADGGHIIANMFEGLYRDTPNGRILAGAKEEPAISADGKVYTFKLREDAKWSNGEPVTAHDYVFGWTRTLNPELPSDYSFIVAPYLKNGTCYMAGDCADGLELGVKAINDYTLEVKLEMEVPYFKDLLAFYTYMPIYSNKGAITSLPDGWEKITGNVHTNGPFEFVEYIIGKHVLLTKSDTYHGADDVKLDGVEFIIIDDATTALNAYKKGDVHVIDTVPMDEISNLLQTEPNFRITSDLGTYFFIFNMDHELIGNPAGANGLKVRQALSMVIDRESIVNNVVKGGQIPAGAFIPPTILDKNNDPWYDPSEASPYGINYSVSAADITAAKALLADAGYSTQAQLDALADTMEIGYNTHASHSHRDVSSAIQESWKTNLGLDVELVASEWSSFLDERKHGDFAFARHGWLGDYPDPNTMLDLFTSYSGNNDAQWRYENSTAFSHDTYLNVGNEAFDTLIENAMNESDPTIREQYLRDAEEILLETEHILTPIYHYNRQNLINRDKVEGVERSLMGTWYFGNAKMK